jgi:hypothetical protein
MSAAARPVTSSDGRQVSFWLHLQLCQGAVTTSALAADLPGPHRVRFRRHLKQCRGQEAGGLKVDWTTERGVGATQRRGHGVAAESGCLCSTVTSASYWPAIASSSQPYCQIAQPRSMTLATSWLRMLLANRQGTQLSSRTRTCALLQSHASGPDLLGSGLGAFRDGGLTGHPSTATACSRETLGKSSGNSSAGPRLRCSRTGLEGHARPCERRGHAEVLRGNRDQGLGQAAHSDFS